MKKLKKVLNQAFLRHTNLINNILRKFEFSVSSGFIVIGLMVTSSDFARQTIGFLCENGIISFHYNIHTGKWMRGLTDPNKECWGTGSLVFNLQCVCVCVYVVLGDRISGFQSAVCIYIYIYTRTNASYGNRESRIIHQ